MPQTIKRQPEAVNSGPIFLRDSAGPGIRRREAWRTRSARPPLLNMAALGKFGAGFRKQLTEPLMLGEDEKSHRTIDRGVLVFYLQIPEEERLAMSQRSPPTRARRCWQPGVLRAL